jgi:hypothetical protein
VWAGPESSGPAPCTRARAFTHQADVLPPPSKNGALVKPCSGSGLVNLFGALSAYTFLLHKPSMWYRCFPDAAIKLTLKKDKDENKFSFDDIDNDDDS